MVSVPDYDPNNPREALDPTRINRLTTGVYEMGSTFKALTLAMALDSGKIDAQLDRSTRACRCTTASSPSTTIHAQNRMLTVPEIFTYSSNIGTARMALALGVEHHKAFLRKLGQLDRLRTELPESAEPLVPKRWGELNTVTIAFGHGLSVAPLQAMMAIGALMNGGYLIPPTFLKRSEEEAMALATRVIKPETSEKMRYLMRLNAEKGTATKADVKGYYVGGKTGTSEKVVDGPLFQDQAAHHLHRGAAGRPAALSAADHARRAAGAAGNPRLSPPRAGTRCRSAAPVIARIAPLLGDRAALRSAAGRQADPGERDG